MARQIKYGIAALLGTGSINSAQIKNDEIVDADVNSNANIDDDKINLKTLKSSNKLAGEDISAYDVVSIGDGTKNPSIEQIVSDTDVYFGDLFNSEARAQGFAGADCIGYPKVLKIKLAKVGSPTDNITIELRSVSQTGALLHSWTKAASAVTASMVEYTFPFTTQVNIVSGTQYFIILKRSTGLDSSNYYVTRRQSTNVYANGVSSYYETGSWYNNAASDLYFVIQSNWASGKVYRSETLLSANIAMISGIAKAAATENNAVTIQHVGIITNASWAWTPGKLVYATDTWGTLSHTAGTQSKVVGRAISATEIVIDMT